MSSTVTPVSPKALESANVLRRLVKWILIGVLAGLLSAIGIIAFLKLLIYRNRVCP